MNAIFLHHARRDLRDGLLAEERQEMEAVFQVVGVVVIDLVDHTFVAQVFDHAAIMLVEVGGPGLDAVPLNVPAVLGEQDALR